MEGVSQFTRGTIALLAFVLLFLAIANASGGRYTWAIALGGVGLAGTAYVLRTRDASAS